MGRRSREHRTAVIAGIEEPFRASPGKPQSLRAQLEEKARVAREGLGENRATGKTLIVDGPISQHEKDKAQEIAEAENAVIVVTDVPTTGSITDRISKLKEQQGG